MGQLLTLEELAKFLQFSEGKVKKLAMNGEIPGVVIGNTWRFDKDAIMSWLEKHKQPVVED